MVPVAAEQPKAVPSHEGAGEATAGAASLPAVIQSVPIPAGAVEGTATPPPSLHSPACATVRFGEAECDCGAPRPTEAAPDYQTRTIASLCDRLGRIYQLTLARPLHPNERLIQIRKEAEGFARVPGEKA